MPDCPGSYAAFVLAALQSCTTNTVVSICTDNCAPIIGCWQLTALVYVQQLMYIQLLLLLQCLSLLPALAHV